MNIFEIRRLCTFEEISFLQLTQILNEHKYADPRSKIRELLKSGNLVRVKKGLYVFGEKAANGPFSREHLANLIFGPSAVSLEYALSFYNLIPEKVEEVTSITTKKNKEFVTPVGRFSYRFLVAKKYICGLTQTHIQGRNVIMATKEKALCDLLILKTKRLKNIAMLKEHLIDNLRIDEHSLFQLNLKMLHELNVCYRKKNVELLCSLLEGKI